MQAESLGKALGLHRAGNTWTGACPACGYRSGFSVEENRGKVLVRCHAGGCDQADVIESLRRLGLWAGEADTDWTPPSRRQTAEEAKPDMQAAARALWHRTVPADNTVEHQGKVYLDLGTADWSVAEIGAEGWRVIPAAPVPVLRSRRARPLPVPVKGGSIRICLQQAAPSGCRPSINFL